MHCMKKKKNSNCCCVNWAAGKDRCTAVVWNAKNIIYYLWTPSSICTKCILYFLLYLYSCICVHSDCVGSSTDVWNAKKQCLRSRGKTRIFSPTKVKSTQVPGAPFGKKRDVKTFWSKMLWSFELCLPPIEKQRKPKCFDLMFCVLLPHHHVWKHETHQHKKCVKIFRISNLMICTYVPL